MPILTPTDKARFFPSVALEGDALLGAISALEAQIQSWDIAARSLDITRYTEVKRLNVATQTVQLSYAPVLATPAPVIRARAGTLLEWRTLESSDFEILGGRLALRGYDAGSDFGRTRPLYSEIEATYSSGLDFTLDTPEINALKAAAGMALDYMVNNNAFKGITAFEVYQEYTARYGAESLAGAIPGSLLSIFRKYRPRSW